jgi:hypothetical protein
LVHLRWAPDGVKLPGRPPTLDCKLCNSYALCLNHPRRAQFSPH